MGVDWTKLKLKPGETKAQALKRHDEECEAQRARIKALPGAFNSELPLKPNKKPKKANGGNDGD